MNYLSQINRAINYIEKNLFEPLDVGQISSESGISKWYFQRIFRAMVGDTLKEYILKRRLYFAAQALLDSKTKVLEIALETGFDSHEVFIRAFKRVFEQTPTDFRQHPKNRSLLPLKLRITTAYLTHLYQGMTMEPTLLHLDTQTLIGRIGLIKPVRENFEHNQTVVSQLWRDFETQRARLPHVSVTEKVGLMTGLGENSIEYCAGLIMDSAGDLPEGFVTRTIPAGDYAQFFHHHNSAQNSIDHTYNYIYGSWLPKSGRTRTDGPEVVLYPLEFHPTQGAEIKILIPLG